MWALPTPGGPDDFPRLVHQIASVDPSRGPSRAARALWAIRWKVGGLLGWDGPDAGLGPRVSTLRDRLAVDLRDAPSGPGFDALPFTSLYLIDDEWAAEIANRTMHGIMHVGWVPDRMGGYRGQMDSGSVFLANRAKAIYAALGIEKHEIEKGAPWQNFSEATFGIQRRVADHHFAEAESWQELIAVHNRRIEDYNVQRHFAHEQREDARRSPSEVLGFLTGIRYNPEDLQRAFFSTRYVRVLDALGYARLMHWRVYGEEALAAQEAALWLDEESLTVEYRGEALSRYDVRLQAETGKLREVKRPQLFDTSHRGPQLRLFSMEDIRWLKALRANDYAPRRPHRLQALQEVLFSYAQAF